MIINEKNRTIELTKEEFKSAHTFGTVEYHNLQQVRRDYPGFHIVTKKVKSRNNMKGLTMAYMEKYIRQHDDNQRTTLQNFAILRGMTIGEKGELVDNKNTTLTAKATYGEIKLWFLETYHEKFEDYGRNVREIMDKAKTAREKRNAG